MDIINFQWENIRLFKSHIHVYQKILKEHFRSGRVGKFGLSFDFDQVMVKISNFGGLDRN